MTKRINLILHNKVIDQVVIKRLINRLINNFEITYTSLILNQLKNLGFVQVTTTSFSLRFDDLLTIHFKGLNTHIDNNLKLLILIFICNNYDLLIFNYIK